jgi:hypothetical protein
MYFNNIVIYRVTVDGVWVVNRFIDHLQVVTTNNCNIIVDFHALQFTRAHNVMFSACY